MCVRTFGSVAAACGLALAAQAENWPQWRGPLLNGISPEKNLPTTWAAEQVKWRTPLPGPSGATPVVWGESVFVSSPDEASNLALLCLERSTGKVRWQKTIVEGANFNKGRGNSASPSPVTDGKLVYVMYATGHLAALDFQGQEVWRRDLGADYGKPSFMWLYGSSPLLYGGKLYVQVLQRTPMPADYPGGGGAAGDRESYLLALEPATGKTLWKHVRPTDALMESMESYATPTVHRGADGQEQLLVVGGDCLTGHNLATGVELWRAYGVNRKKGQFMRMVPSPVSVGELAVACGPKKEQMIAIRTNLQGDVTEKGLAWAYDEKKTPDVCTPLYYQGKLFVLDGDGGTTLTCLDPVTGAKKWQDKLPDRTVIRSSPVAGDGKLYIINEKGVVFVCGTGEQFELLATIPVAPEEPEGTRAAIAISEGQLFIRTTQGITCVGK